MKADSIVSIMVGKSVEMVIAILAVLKSGGAYLPIEISYPKERIEYMLKDSQSKILFSKANLIEDLIFDGECIDLFEDELYTEHCDNLECINSSTDLAYVIYTSGTTGNPKGVMIENRSIINYCSYIVDNAKINCNEQTALLSSFAFDLGYTSLFTSLYAGAKLNILSEEKLQRPEKTLRSSKIWCNLC